MVSWLIKVLKERKKDMDHHPIVKKPKILCLHGHGSSAAILEKQISQWPESVLGELDLVFINAPFPLQDNKDNNYDPLHFEWFQANEVLFFFSIYTLYKYNTMYIYYLCSFYFSLHFNFNYFCCEIENYINVL